MTHLEGGPAAASAVQLSAPARRILRAALGLREGAIPARTLGDHARIYYAPSPEERPLCEQMRAAGWLALASRPADSPYAAAVRHLYIVTRAGLATLTAAERS